MSISVLFGRELCHSVRCDRFPRPPLPFKRLGLLCVAWNELTHGCLERGSLGMFSSRPDFLSTAAPEGWSLTGPRGLLACHRVCVTWGACDVHGPPLPRYPRVHVALPPRDAAVLLLKGL